MIDLLPEYAPAEKVHREFYGIWTRLMTPKIDLWILATRTDMNKQDGFFPWAVVFILAFEFATIVYLGGIR